MTKLSLLLLALSLSCKTRSDKSPQKETPSENTGSNLIQNQIDAGRTPDINIHVFDDEERLYLIPNEVIDNAREEYKQEQQNSSEPFDETVFTTLYSLNLEEQSLKTFHDNYVDAPQGLNLSIPLVTRVSIKKTVYRTLQDIQEVWRIVQSKIKFVFGIGTGNYKHDYFYDAVTKKWTDAKYSKFDQMKDLSTSVRFYDKNGNQINGFRLNHNLKNLGGSKIFLGMLPNTSILLKLRKKIQTASDAETFNIHSFNEEFEFLHARRHSSLGNHEPNILTKKYLSKDRYVMTLEIGAQERSMGISDWTQYSTPDRTMMTADLLEAAIDSIGIDMRKNTYAFVHCKSGKGRSATAVVGARVDIIMQEARQMGAILDERTINELIEEQIRHVQAARSEVGISPMQKANLQKVLYRRAGILK